MDSILQIYEDPDCRTDVDQRPVSRFCRRTKVRIRSIIMTHRTGQFELVEEKIEVMSPPDLT